MFVCSGNNWFEDFLIEGSPTSGLYAFHGNDASAIHIRRVDMLNNGNTATQRFLKQKGANWKVLFVEDCIVDYRGAKEYAVLLQNTSNAARAVDTNINNVFFDAYALTDYGGSFLIRDCRDVRFKRSTIRGSPCWNTGIRLERLLQDGTPSVEIRQCDMASVYNTSGGVSVYTACSTQAFISNSDCPDSVFDGASFLRNSYTLPA
jgi:hypothetical protein